MDLSLDDLSDESLREQITTWAGRVAAGEAMLLRLIGELDAREAWAQHGVLSCAHWVSWKLAYSSGTAREKVRVAGALRTLPLAAAAMSEGKLSYSQARAITRVATPKDEHTWVELARQSTAEQLEKAVRGTGRSLRNEERAANPDKVDWEDRVRYRWNEQGTLVVTMHFSAEHGPAVIEALETAQKLEQADRDVRLAELAAELAASEKEGSKVPAGDVPAGTPPVPWEPYVYVEPAHPVTDWGAPITPQMQERILEWEVERDRRRALRDAWREQEERLAAEAAARRIPAARATLADGLVRALTRPGGTPPKVHLLIDPVSGWARTSKDELLPPSTLRTMVQTLPGSAQQVRPLTVADLQRHDQGRRLRVVGPRLRELLGQLDGERCRFPSCTRTRKLHAHHVLFWRDGGNTDLSNLVLVCSRHHTLIHQHGFQLSLNPDRTLTVQTADGTMLLHHPELPWQPADDLDPERVITADTLPTQWTGERLDLGYVVNVMRQHAA